MWRAVRMPVAPHHFSLVRPEHLACVSETSKSGKDQLRLIDTRVEWTLSVELAPLEITWEKASGDGTLGHFGITDERRANYTLTLAPVDAEGTACVAFVKDTCAFIARQFEEDYPSLPFGSETAFGSELRVKRRLCKWAKEGTTPARDPIPVYVDGSKTSEPLGRGDLVQATVQFTPWRMDSGTFGISLRVTAVVVRAARASGASPSPPKKSPSVISGSMSIPDLPPIKKFRAACH